MKAQTLKAYFVNNNHKRKWIENKKKYGSVVKNSELSNSDKKQQNVQNGKEKFDKKKVQCYSCNMFGHFAADC